MKKVGKFNAAMALGSLTAAVALLAGTPVASAQQAPASDSSVAGDAAAPGGGSFPGSFLVPGTNTSLKVGGFAKWDAIYDMSAGISPFSSQVMIPTSIPLNGAAGHQLHGSLLNDVRQSNFNFDVRTPTSYGELDIFALFDGFGQQTTPNLSLNGVDAWTVRFVQFYGALGPLMAGQTLSLWFDGDALGESVDPTTSVGAMNGLSNRNTSIRYTYAGAGGFSAAVAVQQPNPEGFTNAGLPASAAGATGIVQNLNTAAVTATGAGTFQDLGLSGGWVEIPDFIARLRLDQAWGHLALTGLLRDQTVHATGVRFDRTTGGGEISGHLNTFGKDTLRGDFMIGTGLGSYLSDMGSLAGMQVSTVAAGAGLSPHVTAPVSYGGYLSYTHWWTDMLRSSVAPGFSHLDLENSIITGTANQNALDRRHIGATGNLIWSPVPQVDIGIEFDWVQRTTWSYSGAGNTGTSNQGTIERIESEVVFKF
ncbi:MAG TPA: porin [Stellaceae bacterium]|nr:porin [Stellaceae bacterium]